MELNPNGASSAYAEITGLPAWYEGATGIVFRAQKAMPDMDKLAGM